MKSIQKLFGRYYKKYCIAIVFLFMITLMQKALSVLLPLMTEKIINIVTEKEALHEIERNIVLFIAISFGFVIALSVRYYLQGRLEIKVINDLKKRMLNKIVSMDYNILNSQNTGYYLQRFNSDVDSVESIFVDDFIAFTTNIIYGAFVIYVMLKSSIIISLVLFIIIPIFYISTKKIVPSMRKIRQEEAEKSELMNTKIEEMVLGGLEIKANDNNGFVIRKTEKLLGELNKCKERYLKMDIIYDIVLNTGSMNIGNVVIFCIGGYLAYKGMIQVGAIVAFGMYYSKIWDIIDGFMSFFKDYKIKLVSVDRVNEYLELADEKDDAKISELGKIEKINFDDVSCKYDDRVLFDGFNMDINSGDKIGIYGGNGSGKTTLAKMLIKIKNADSGKITCNGIDIMEYSTDAIRRKITFIPANPVIFDGTVSENMFTDNLDADFYKYIEQFELKNQILKSADGKINRSNLSAGEMKIIQLLRGLNKKSDVYILDEPLNFIDETNKQEIFNFIKENFKDKTLIIISHDKDVFALCDKIVLMNGQVVNAAQI